MASGAKLENSSQVRLMDAATPTKLTAYQGVLHVAYGEHEFSGTDIGVIADMVRVPNGARIIDTQAYWDALGAATEITVGDSDDTDRFMTTCPTNRAFVSGSTAVGAALLTAGSQSGIYFFFGTGRLNRVSGGTDKTVSSSEVGAGYRYTCEKDITISVNDRTATGTVSLTVHYIVS